MARLGVPGLLLVASSVLIAAEQGPRPVIGGRVEHVVQPGDSLASLGARYGVESRVLARTNGLRDGAGLAVGRPLAIDTRHIVPAQSPGDEIVINLPQRMLFQFREDRLAAAYPVAVGLPTWPTFTGPFTVVLMETDPVWDVPLTIQEEQRRAGRPVLTRVPPGPSNPLGRHWLALDAPGYGIHGTNAPASIYGFRTHGCIRLHPDDIAALYATVQVGTRGRMVYEPVLFTVLTTGEILLEIHPDPYRRLADPLAAVRVLASHHGLMDQVDWDLVSDALGRRDGTPVDVRRQPHR